MRSIFCFTLSCLLWAGGFLLFVFDAERMSSKESHQEVLKEKTDAIIVLTGARYRIKEGLTLLQKKAAPKILISGVLTPISKSSVIYLSGFKGHVPRSKIHIDYDSQTTIQNAKNSDKWIQKQGVKKVHLVTSSYHMRRSLLEFDARVTGVELLPYAVSPLKPQVKPWNANQKMLFLYLTEYTKYLVAYIKNIIMKFF